MNAPIGHEMSNHTPGVAAEDADVRHSARVDGALRLGDEGVASLETEKVRPGLVSGRAEEKPSLPAADLDLDRVLVAEQISPCDRCQRRLPLRLPLRLDGELGSLTDERSNRRRCHDDRMKGRRGDAPKLLVSALRSSTR